MNEKDRIENIYYKYSSSQKYTYKWSNTRLGNQLIEKERFIKIKNLFKSNSIELKNKIIIDIGCAGGNTISLLKNLGASEKNICGIDLREKRLNIAKKSFPKANFELMDARKIKFPDQSFDFINVFTVLTSILDSDHRHSVSKELVRILRPGGYILYYDFRFNNPFNKNVRGIKLEEIKLLFPNMEKDLKLITVFPPMIRMLSGLAKNLYPVFSKTSFLKTHYLSLIKKAN